MIHRGPFAFVLCLCLVIVAPSTVAAQTPVEPNSHVAGETTLEGRLLAPCCWNQTLDIHESELARELRTEIRRRLAAGEASSVIEDNLVARYGERIRAVPKGKTLTGMGAWLTLVFALAGIGIAVVVIRWARRAKRNASSNTQPHAQETHASKDAWDERLDAELREMD